MARTLFPRKSFHAASRSTHEMRQEGRSQKVEGRTNETARLPSSNFQLPTSNFRTSKRRWLALAVAAIGAGSLFQAGHVQAASTTWNGGSATNGNWSTGGDWASGSAPGATSGTTSADSATFANAIANTWGNSASNPVVIDSATQNIKSIYFNANAGNYYIGSTIGNSLLLTTGGTIQLATPNGTNVIETINAPLVIEGAAGTYTITNTSANGAGAGAGTLNIGGGIKGGAAGATVLTLGGANTNANTISGIITNGSATSMAVSKLYTYGLGTWGTGTWDLSAANTYTGATTVTAGTLGLTSFTGSSANSAFNVATATLAVDSSSGTAAASVNRTASLTLNSGALTVAGTSAGNTNDIFGNLAISGASSNTVALTPNSSTNALATFGTWTRNAGGVVVFSGTSLGINTLASTTANSTNINFTTAPALVGAGGGTGTTNESIVVGAFGGTTGTASDVLTYDTTYGLRAPTLYATTITSGDTTKMNAKLTTSVSSINAATTVNSLILGASGSVEGTGTLTVNSGMILATGATTDIGATTAGTLAFGSAEAIFNTNSGSTLTVASVITGSGGLTKAGTGTLILNGAMSGFTGATTLLGGTLNLGANSWTTTNLSLTGLTTGTVAITGSGTLTVTGAGGVDLSPAAGATAATTVDLSGLTAFTYNQSGQPFSFNGEYNANSTLKLAATNTITASTINIATGGLAGVANGVTTTVLLGQNNSFNTATFQLGNYHNTAATVQFASTGTLTLRGTGGGTTSATNLNVGSNSNGAAPGNFTLDTTGGAGGTGVIDAIVTNLYVVNSLNATYTATFSMANGTVNAGTIWANSYSGTGTYTTTAIFNQNAGTVLTGTLNFNKNAQVQTGAASTFYSTYNLGPSSGTATAGLLSAQTISMATTVATNTASWATLNFYNGTIENYEPTLAQGSLAANARNGATAQNLTIAGFTGGGTAVDSLTLNIALAATGTHNFYAENGYSITEQSTAMITGAGGLTANGPGTVILQGSNSYSGGTTVSAGTVLFQYSNSKPTTGTVTVSAGATLGLGLSGTGAFTTTDVGNLFASNFTGNVVNVSMASTSNVGLDTTNGNVTYAGPIGSSTYGLVKLGANTLTLSGSNSYSGGTTLAGTGTLNVTNSSALGSGTLYLQSAQAGTSVTLGISGGITLANPIAITDSTGRENITVSGTGNNSLTGGITSTSGSNQIIIADSSSSGNLTVSGGVSGANFSGALSFRGSSSGQGLMNGVINVSGEVNNNGSTNWTFNTAGSTWSAFSFYGAGSANLGATNAFPTGSPVHYTNTSTGTLNLNGYNQTVGGIYSDTISTGNGGIITNTNTYTTTGYGQDAVSVLTVNVVGQNRTYLGSIVDGSRQVALVVNNTGAYSQTLSGSNTYTGGTSITAGTLNLNGGTLGGGASGGTAITVSGTFTEDAAGIIAGASSFAMNAAGNTSTLAGANTYTGVTTVSAGTLSTGSAGSFALGGSNSFIGASSNAAANLVLNGGTLQYANTGAAQTTDRLFTMTGGLTTSALDASGSNSITFSNTGSIAFTGTNTTQTLNLTGTGTGLLNSIIADNGGTGGATAVTKSGTGTWTLAGSNSYSGSTTINAGTLTMTGGSPSGTPVTLAGSVTGAGTLVIGNGTTGTYVSLNGSTNTYTVSNIVLNANARFDIWGASSPTTNLTGAITLNGGTLAPRSHAIIYGGNITVNNDVQLGAGSGIGATFNGTTFDLGGATRTLTFSAGGNPTVSISNVIQNGGLNLVTSSTTIAFQFSGANTYSGNTKITTGALTLTNNLALQNSAIDTSGTGTITLSGITTPTFGGLVDGTGPHALATVITTGYSSMTGITLNPGSSVNNTYSGVIADGHANMTLTKTGAGTQTLAGSNTYTGGTAVTAGTFNLTGSLNGSSAATSGTGIFTESATGVIAGSGITFTQGGSGTSILAGSNTFAGGTTINAGSTLQIGNGGSTGALSSSTATSNVILDNGNLTFNRNNTVTQGLDFSGSAITGTGSLTQAGTGTLILTGSHSYSGPTTISAGKLILDHSASNTGALGETAVSLTAGGTVLAIKGTTNIGTTSAASLNLGSGTLDLRDASINSLSIGGNLTLNNSAIDLDLSNTGATGTCDSLVVHGAASPTGTTTINLNLLGTLVAGNYTIISATGGLGSGFTIGTTPAGRNSFALSSSSATAEVLTVSTAAAQPSVYWTGSASNAGSDTANLWAFGTTLINWSTDPAGSTPATQVPGAISDVTFAATNATPVSGTVNTQLDAAYTIKGLTVNTAGTTQTINGVGIDLHGNTLTIGSAANGVDGLIVTSGALTINDSVGGGSVLLGASQTWANNAAQNLIVSTAVSGDANLGTTQTLTLAGTGSGGVTFGGNLTDSGFGGKLALVFNQAGVTTLLGSNTFTGGVTIQSGTVKMGSATALNTPANTLVFDTGSTGKLQLYGNSITVSSLNTTATGATIENGLTSTTSVLTDTTTGTDTFQGTLQNGAAGTLALALTGSGTLNVTGANTYTGGTSIAAGLVSFGATGLGTTGAITMGGGTLQWKTGNTLDLSSRLTLVNGKTAVLDIGSNNVTFGTAFGGSTSGSLVKLGSGTLTLTSNASTYTGGTTINGGTINITADGSDTASALGVAHPLVVNSGGIIRLAHYDSLGYYGGNPSPMILSGGIMTIAAGFHGSVANFGITLNGGTITAEGPGDAYPGNANYIFDGTITTLANATTTSVISGYGVELRNGGIFNVADGAVTTDLLVSTALDSGAVIKTGAGLMQLTGSNTYTGGTTISAGTLSASNIVVGSNNYSNLGYATSPVVLSDGTYTGILSYTGTTATYTRGFTVNAGGGEVDVTTAGQTLTIGTGNITGTGLLTLGGAGNTIVNSVIGTGSGGLTKNGTGTVTLTGSNTYTGTTTVNQGELDLASSGLAIPSATLIVGNGLHAPQSDILKLLGDNQILGTAAVAINGTDGKFDLNGYSQTIASLADTGTFTPGGSTVNLGGGSLTVTGGTSTTYSGGLTDTGSGTLIKGTGSGTLTLAGGSLSFGNAVVNGGKLNFGATAGTVTLGTLSGTTSFGAGANVGGTLSQGTISVAGNGTFGTLAGASLSITGNGTLTTVSSGSLTVGGTSTITTVSGGTLNLNGATAGISTLTGSGAITLGSSTVLSVGDTASNTFSGTISGAGSLIKTNSGTLILSGSNSYGGGTTVSAGTLALGNATALGASSGAVSVATGAVLDLNGMTLTNTNALTLNGTGISGGGALTNSSVAPAGYAGPVTLGSAGALIGGTGTIALTNTGALGGAGYNLTLNGAGGSIAGSIATGTGTVTVNAGGTWILSGASTYTGGTAVTAGTLNLTGSLSASSVSTSGTGIFTESATGVIAGSGITFTQGSSGTSILAGSNTYTGTTTINAGGILQIGNGSTAGSLSTSSAILDNGNLTFNRNNTVTQGLDFSGSAITGTGSLTQAGTGTLILTGSNSYSGGTTINSSTLQLGNGGTTGSLAATSVITDSGTLIFNRSNTVTQGTDFGTITGTGGNLIQSGSGNLILAGSNAYSGITTVNSGMLSVSNLAGAAGTNDSLGVFSSANTQLLLNGGTLDYTGTDVVTHRTFSLNDTGSAGAVTITSTGGALNFSPADITAINTPTGATILTLAGDGTAANTLGLKLSDTGTAAAVSLVKAGSGTWILAAGIDNASVHAPGLWRGNTTISAGTLQLGATEALPSLSTFKENKSLGTNGNVLLASGATLDLHGYGNTINGLGDAGPVDAAHPSWITNLQANSTALLAVGDNDQTTTFSGVIQNGATVSNGVVALAKMGAGTLTLNGSNSYSGGTTIQNGTVVLGAAGALPSGTALVMSPTTNTGGNTPTLDLGGQHLSVSTLNGTTAASAAVPLGYDHIVVEGWNYKAGGIFTHTPPSGGDVIELLDGSGKPVMPTGLLVGQSFTSPDYASGTTIAAISGLYVQLSSSFTGSTIVNYQPVNSSGTFGGVSAGTSSNTPIVSNNGTNAALLTVGTGVSGNSSTYAGVIQDGTAAVALELTGSNRLTLTGSNTFTGGTTIGTGSTLLIGDGVTNGSRIAGNISDNGTLTVNTPAGDPWTYSGTISGDGVLNLTGGTLKVTGTLANNQADHIILGTSITAPTSFTSNTPAITRTFAQGAYYANIGSSINTDRQTTASLLAGTIVQGNSDNSGNAVNLSMAWRTPTTGESFLFSDVVRLTGMTFNSTTHQTDDFVLAMSYDPNQAGAGSPLFLGTFVGNGWVSAVSQNIGAGEYAGRYTYSWQTFLDNHTGATLAQDLGAYGIDLSGHTVWAVLDHNSDFAVIPEPTSLGLLGLGALGLLARKRRKVVG